MALLARRRAAHAARRQQRRFFATIARGGGGVEQRQGAAEVAGRAPAQVAAERRRLVRVVEAEGVAELARHRATRRERQSRRASASPGPRWAALCTSCVAAASKS